MDTWTRRVLVVEDEALVSLLLTDLLTRANFEVATCASAAEVNALVREFDPDVALLDINLGSGPSGLDVGHILHRAYPHIGLVFLTKFLDPRVRRERAIPPGSAFLDKKSITDTAALIDAIERVLQNESPPRDDEHRPGGLDVLTPIQLETLRLAALGMTNSAIARKRDTNERAVEKRLRAVYIALGIRTDADVNPRVEAIRRYIAEAGLPADAGAGRPGDAGTGARGAGATLGGGAGATLDSDAGDAGTGARGAGATLGGGAGATLGGGAGATLDSDTGDAGTGARGANAALVSDAEDAGTGRTGDAGTGGGAGRTGDAGASGAEGGAGDAAVVRDGGVADG